MIEVKKVGAKPEPPSDIMGMDGQVNFITILNLFKKAIADGVTLDTALAKDIAKNESASQQKYADQMSGVGSGADAASKLAALQAKAAAAKTQQDSALSGVQSDVESGNNRDSNVTQGISFVIQQCSNTYLAESGNTVNVARV